MAWLTGNAPTADDFICRRLFIPNEQSIIIAVNGALGELGKAENWEQFGTLSPDEAAQLMLTMTTDFFYDNCNDDSGNNNGGHEVSSISRYVWNDGEPIPANLSMVWGSIDPANNRINSEPSGRINFDMRSTLAEKSLILGLRIIVSEDGYTNYNFRSYITNSLQHSYNGTFNVNSHDLALYPNQLILADGAKFYLLNNGSTSQMYVESFEIVYLDIVP